ncbi:hypothetical protein BCR37DRAFT_395893 [Protomyces lactucae-debilis]|uniref:Hydrophobic surface binding protein A-domain-containing protein n=1 Tax=Protomyces lactucae-debilis TaxID=2754530 RepID=A0A1Y2EQU3_PROLT|nr:uncharacterized protein BCR37DRAFT_395893 [Protomyces lactucae-debilis]ORY73902.1 hypothetical protein BCR37DRAFT_395893 [Protomyces lactucae-debilis]
MDPSEFGMLVQQLLTIFACSYTLAAPVETDAVREPTPEGLVSDLSTLQTSLKAMTKAVSAYNGGLSGVSAINTASKTVNTAIARMDDDAESVQLTDAVKAQPVLQAIIDTEPVIQETLDSIVSKKKTFSNALRPKVSTALDKLVVNTLSLGRKLEAGSTPDFAPKLRAETDKLEDSFQKAQTDFKSKQ